MLLRYHGLEVLGSGAILVSLIRVAFTAFMIDLAFMSAAGFALAARSNAATHEGGREKLPLNSSIEAQAIVT